MVVVHHVSNVLGSMLPIEEIVTWSKRVGAKVLVDACQSVPHMPVDVQKLGADFLVASSHKTSQMCGPTGVGFMHGTFEMLSSMEPFLGGGEMIVDVFNVKSTYAEPPSRLGTPAIGEAIGLGAAIDYLSCIGMDQIHEYEKELATYLYESLLSVPNVRIYGLAPSQTDHRAPLCSFNVENVHPSDISVILNDQHGVAIRPGDHCAQILHRTLGINSLVQVFTFTVQKRWMFSSMHLKIQLTSLLLNTSAVELVSSPFLPVSSFSCLSCCMIWFGTRKNIQGYAYINSQLPF